MKREILFRGKDKYGKWHEGYCATSGKNHHMPDVMHFIICGEPCQKYIGRDFHEVIKDTVSEYAGRTDKNGTRIFEGDKIEEGTVYFDTDYLGFFVIGDFSEGEHMPLYDIPIVEVIGNIHDNTTVK